MARKIALTNSRLYVLVDDQDYAYLSQRKWYLSSQGYPTTHHDVKGEKRRTLSIHQVIMNPPNGMQVDHINHFKLDNRRSNLRLCTVRQNSYNRRITRRNTSGYKGVSKMNRRRLKKPYTANIYHQGRTYFLGTFSTPTEAAIAYNKKAKELFGEFARMNSLTYGT